MSEERPETISVYTTVSVDSDNVGWLNGAETVADDREMPVCVGDYWLASRLGLDSVLPLRQRPAEGGRTECCQTFLHAVELPKLRACGLLWEYGVALVKAT